MRQLLPLALLGLVACAAPPPTGTREPAAPTPARMATPRPRPTPSPTPVVIGERDVVLETAVGSGVPGYAGDGGSPQEARLSTPTGLAISRGDLLIADQANHRIRRLTYDGELETFVGTGVAGFNGDGAALTELQLNSPYKILSDDATGLIFIADRGNGLIRCIDPSNRLITVAGGGQASPGTAPITGLDAKIEGIAGMAIDSEGHLYIAETSTHRILRLNVDHEWKIAVHAGAGSAGFSGDHGPALQARFNQPVDLAIDAQDNLYVADMGNHRIRKISPEGVVTTLAGNGLPGFYGDGRAAEDASLNLPSAVASDNQGNIFLADSGNQRIRVVRPDGSIVTLAGTGAAGYSGDGGLPGLGTFNGPWAIAYSPTGGLYVADRNNHAVRHFNVP